MIWCRSLDEIRVLCQNGVDLATGDYDDRTALHLAAAEDQVERARESARERERERGGWRERVRERERASERDR